MWYPEVFFLEVSGLSRELASQVQIKKRYCREKLVPHFCYSLHFENNLLDAVVVLAIDCMYLPGHCWLASFYRVHDFIVSTTDCMQSLWGTMLRLDITYARNWLGIEIDWHIYLTSRVVKIQKLMTDLLPVQYTAIVYPLLCEIDNRFVFGFSICLINCLTNRKGRCPCGRSVTCGMRVSWVLCRHCHLPPVPSLDIRSCPTLPAV